MSSVLLAEPFGRLDQPLGVHLFNRPHLVKGAAPNGVPDLVASLFHGAEHLHCPPEAMRVLVAEHPAKEHVRINYEEGGGREQDPPLMILAAPQRVRASEAEAPGTWHYPTPRIDVNRRHRQSGVGC